MPEPSCSLATHRLSANPAPLPAQAPLVFKRHSSATVRHRLRHATPLLAIGLATRCHCSPSARDRRVIARHRAIGSPLRHELATGQSPIHYDLTASSWSSTVPPPRPLASVGSRLPCVLPLCYPSLLLLYSDSQLSKLSKELSHISIRSN